MRILAFSKFALLFKFFLLLSINTEIAAETLTEKYEVFADKTESSKKGWSFSSIFDVVGFKTIEWEDLIPKKDLEALDNPPSYINNMEDGAEYVDPVQAEKSDPYHLALKSTNIKPEMDGQDIRIPGFIVPVVVGRDKKTTEFFLVPYFGACIHVPPPPPNQIIYVTYSDGLKVDNLETPFWISGTLETSIIENQLATAAYVMEMDSYEAYSEE